MRRQFKPHSRQGDQCAVCVLAVPGKRDRGAENTGGLNVNREFEFIYRSCSDRLARLNTTEACGPWSSIVFQEVHNDSQFMRAADDLFSQVMAQHFKAVRFSSDGVSLEGGCWHLVDGIRAAGGAIIAVPRNGHLLRNG